jgi:enoyl-CoA hydratase/carnithine racemase
MKGKNMEFKQTRYDVEGSIAKITLYRPNELNAFTPQMRKELVEIFQEVDNDDAIRVAIVTGSGRAFCAGADLSSGGFRFDYAKEEEPEIRINEHRDGGGRLSLAIYRCKKPVIAAINGPAVGVGITMTLPMDIRIVAEDAKIGFVFARRGVVPEACSSYFLPRIIGISKATELVYTGRVFRAKEEAQSGLFNYIVPNEEVIPKAMEIAREISENTAPLSIALSKAMLWHGLSEDDPQSVHLIDSRCFFWTGSQPDAKEGIASFLEKRAPKFSMKVSQDMPDFYPWWKEPKV